MNDRQGFQSEKETKTCKGFKKSERVTENGKICEPSYN